LDPDDIFGDNKGPFGWSNGPTTAAAGNGAEAVQNAYDPKTDLNAWTTGELSMFLPLPDEPVTCEDICKQKHKDADEKCSVARKRIELGLKKAGCPSKVLAVRRKTACGGRKAAPKKAVKKTTTTRRGR
jgi:hypothetical protein